MPVQISTYVLDLLRSPIRSTIPNGALFRISQGFFSTYYLLSVSNCHFLGLTCNSEENTNFAAEDDIREAVAFRAGTQGDLIQNFPTFWNPNGHCYLKPKTKNFQKFRYFLIYSSVPNRRVGRNKRAVGKFHTLGCLKK